MLFRSPCVIDAPHDSEVLLRDATTRVDRMQRAYIDSLIGLRVGERDDPAIDTFNVVVQRREGAYDMVGQLVPEFPAACFAIREMSDDVHVLLSEQHGLLSHLVRAEFVNLDPLRRIERPQAEGEPDRLPVQRHVGHRLTVSLLASNRGGL